jgi:Transglycosylase SLT domain
MGRFLRRAHSVATPVKLPRRSARTTGRIAAVGALAVLGVTLHTGDPARAVVVSPAGSAAGSIAVPVGGAAAGTGYAGPARGSAAGSGPAKTAAQAGSFRQIILPDLLIVAPKGLTARQIARLGKIRGLRSMITFDGAEITAGGRAVSVIGVNPATFRSWVPLRTASDQAFWTALASGDFVAAPAASKALTLKAGKSYQLSGASAQVVKFGMAAKLDLAGVDLMVNQATSARLGLVHRVAGLISAPAVSMTTLTRKVARILGPGGRIEQLRSQLPVSSVAAGTQPASYIQLFKASAAKYCPGLSWTVLAAIGQIESGDGANEGPSTAGALGPMQFLPSTWSQWGIDAFGQTGPPNVLNPYDAVPSAARLLCADGAAAGGQRLRDAIFDYNHADWYVSEVLGLAAEYAADYR